MFKHLPDLRKGISSISSGFGTSSFELYGCFFEFCTTSVVITGAFVLKLASIGYMVAEKRKKQKRS